MEDDEDNGFDAVHVERVLEVGADLVDPEEDAVEVLIGFRVAAGTHPLLVLGDDSIELFWCG